MVEGVPGSLEQEEKIVSISLTKQKNTISCCLPVDWSRDLVLVTSLERIDHTEDFGGVATSASWVGEHEADCLLRVDHEHAADGEGDAFLIYVGGILMIDPESYFRQPPPC